MRTQLPIPVEESDLAALNAFFSSISCLESDGKRISITRSGASG